MEVWDIFRDCKSGIDFENTVVKFLRCLAFEANRTGKDDGGIDIVATTSILSTKYTFYIVMASPHLLDHLYSMILFGQFGQVIIPVLVLWYQAA